MLMDELRAREARLTAEIQRLEATIRPLEQELSKRKEQYLHVARLLELDSGTEDGVAVSETQREDEGTQNLRVPLTASWAAIAKAYAIHVGGDSAHRRVRRVDPGLHSQVHAIRKDQCDL